MTPRPAARSPSLPRCVLLGLLLLAAAPARAADPLLMFFLGFAKNLIESSLEENANKPGTKLVPVTPLSVAPAVPVAVDKAPASMTSADLKALVEDSFAYLSAQQRAELLTGLEKTLADPALAVQRDAILTEFVGVARQAGYAHRQLDRLSSSQKRALAGQFAANYRALTPEQQQELLQQLRLRALPLPADLNDMMLTALAAAP
jgi:hypothetical protein